MAIPNIKQVADAVYTTLNADSALTTLASLVSGPTINPSTTRPYVSIRPLQGLTDVSTKNSYGFEYDLQIMAVSDDNESSVELDNIVDLIIEDLHMTSLSFATDNHMVTLLTGVTPAVTSDDLNGMILSFKITIVD